MDVIELECPHCGDALELDAAFAGGVCRCSTCGTLMTVPADPARERAEAVTRRDRPDAPGGAPASAGGGRPDVPGGAVRPDAPPGGSARPDAPSSARPDSPAPAPAASSPTAVTDELYITSSGKSLKLAEAVVPTARKRKKVIRATVIGAFVAFVLVIIGVIALAISLLMNAGKPKPETPDHVGIDPNVNPIKAAEANVLGIPIASETAIVMDATGFARQWYPWMREIIGHAVGLSAATDYMIIPWTDLNPKSFPSKKPEKIGPDKLAALDKFLAGPSNVNDASPAAFVGMALEERADQIILIAGQPLDEAEVQALRDAIAKRVDTRVDAIAIGAHDAGLEQLAKDNKGKYISVTTEQLQKWHADWKKGDAK